MEQFGNRREAFVGSPEAGVDKRFTRLEEAVKKILQAGPTTLHKVNIETYDNPVESEVVIDWPTQRFCWYHDDNWICVPFAPTHAIKVYSDKRVNKVQNGAFRFDIERDLDGYVLWDVAAFNGTVGSGPTTVQIQNLTKGLNLLTTVITIDAGETNSYTAGTQPVINNAGPDADPNNMVHIGNTIWINVLSAGTGSKGLGVYMTFVLPRIDT